MKLRLPLLAAVVPALFVLTSVSAFAAAAAKAPPPEANDPTPAPAPLPKTDEKGNPLRRAPTGHVSNYDENKVRDYILPDPLVLQNGQPVRNADTWFKLRRPELIRLYESEVYGRVPASAPKVTFEAFETDSKAMNGAAVRKNITIRFGDHPGDPKLNVTLYLPSRSNAPVPVLLHATFFGQPASGAAPAPTADKKAPRVPELGPIADILARGYGYAFYRYTEIQPDSAATNQSGVQAMAYAAGQTKPALDEWGTIAVWAWAASKVMDYFETDHAIDAKRVALIGHSRLGKTVLWAGARDPRFALVFSSCAGEMGSALSRRDYGETIDDMAANFPWQFAGNFQKYSGHWNNLPVDAHMLIALNAPHAVFISGGTTDQWADPYGEYLAEVEAGAVYRLLGKKDLAYTGPTPVGSPPVDTPMIEGDLGFNYHTGGHTITASDWKAFLDFADRHLQSAH